jgi:hypothetical protein
MDVPISMEIIMNIERYLDRYKIDQMSPQNMSDDYAMRVAAEVLIQFAADQLEADPSLWPAFIEKYGEYAADWIMPKFG